MHIRYPRAAVESDEPSRPTAPSALQGSSMPAPKGQTTRVLWASQSLGIPDGRLVGVRLRGQFVEVGLVRAGAAHPRWLPAASVLTEAQVNRWLRIAKFRP
ncbi:MAG: hypothetical protein ACK5PF_10000 [bacterium]|jgi:hypothetical protein